jgi:hypothetical protein
MLVLYVNSPAVNASLPLAPPNPLTTGRYVIDEFCNTYWYVPANATDIVATTDFATTATTDFATTATTATTGTTATTATTGTTAVPDVNPPTQVGAHPFAGRETFVIEGGGFGEVPGRSRGDDGGNTESENGKVPGRGDGGGSTVPEDGKAPGRGAEETFDFGSVRVGYRRDEYGTRRSLADKYNTPASDFKRSERLVSESGETTIPVVLYGNKTRVFVNMSPKNESHPCHYIWTQMKRYEDQNPEKYHDSLYLLIRHQLASCQHSALVAFFASKLAFAAPNETLVHPETFSDPAKLWNFGFNVTRALMYAMNHASYRLQKNASVTTPWRKYAEEVGVEDEFGIRLMSWLEMLVNVTLRMSSDGERPPLLLQPLYMFSNFWATFVRPYLRAFDGDQYKQVLVQRRLRRESAFPKIKAMNEDEHNTFVAKVRRFAGDSAPRVLGVKAEDIDWDAAERHREKTMTVSRYVAWRTRTAMRNSEYVRTPEWPIYLGDDPDVNGFVSVKRRTDDVYAFDAVPMGNFSAADIPDFNITYCISSVCLNCTILTDTIDQVINVSLTACEQMFLAPLDVGVTNFTRNNTFAQPGDPDPPVPVDYTVDFAAADPLGILKLLFKIWPNLERYLTDGSYFFVNWQPNQPWSARFWLEFAATCDVQTQGFCSVGRAGLGLWPSVFWVFLVTLAISLVFVLFLPSLPVSYLWLAALFAILPLAYFYSPTCQIPSMTIIPIPPFFVPLPYLPDCLANDVYAPVLTINPDCIQWDTTFPGMTTEACGTPLRPFTNCAEKYGFDSTGFRSLAYFLDQFVSESIIDFIFDTTFVLFSWIPGTEFGNLIDVRDLRGNVEARSCFWWTIPAILPGAALTIGALVFGSLGVYLGWLIFLVGALVLVALVRIVYEFLLLVWGTLRQNKFFYRSREIPVPPAPSLRVRPGFEGAGR